MVDNLTDIQTPGHIAVPGIDGLMSKTDKVRLDALAEFILKGLDGGTTGQVLSKKSGADYDFEWITVE